MVRLRRTQRRRPAQENARAGIVHWTHAGGSCALMQDLMLLNREAQIQLSLALYLKWLSTHCSFLAERMRPGVSGAATDAAPDRVFCLGKTHLAVSLLA